MGFASVVVWLAACGGGGPSAKTITEAAKKTTAYSSAATAYDGKISVPTIKRKIPYAGTGVIDNRSHRTRFGVDMSGFARAAGGKGALERFKGEEIVDAAGQIVIYFNIPFFTKDPAKPWQKIELDNALRDQTFSVGSPLNQDPAQYLDYLNGVSGKVEKVGSEQVDGVETTRYKGAIDLLHAPDALPEVRQRASRTVVNRLVKLTEQRFYPTDVWIDEEGRVRQLTFTYSVPLPDSDARITYELTLRYSGFGTQAPVSLPPAGQVSSTGTVTVPGQG